jgi:hypothetical protein
MMSRWSPRRSAVALSRPIDSIVILS